MLFKLTFNTLAGLFLVLALFGRNAPQEAPEVQVEPAVEVSKAETSPIILVTPAKIDVSSAPAAVITPLFTKTAPQPALVSSPEYRAAVAAPAAVASGDIRVVTVGSLNVRARPSGSSTRVDSITRGEEVLVIAEQDGWAKIHVEGDGIDGWVSAKFLK